MAADGQTDEAEGEAEEARHPIGVVESRTGLSAHTLRAWERRYGVVEPHRSEGGHRLYSDADIEHLRLLHELTRRDRRIGQLADRSPEQLREQLREDRAAELTAPGAEVREDSQVTRIAAFLDEARAAVGDFDAERLDALLRRAALTLSVGMFVDDLVGPLLRDVGRAWEEGEIRPAHEHLASAIVVRVTSWLMENFEPEPEAPWIVVGTLAGDRHELGALFVAVTAAAEGWRVRYLGPDLPAEDLALAARQGPAVAVAVSLVYSESESSTASELRRLRRGLPSGIALLVGGAGSEAQRLTLEEIDAIRVDGFRSLQTTLRSLREKMA